MGRDRPAAARRKQPHRRAHRLAAQLRTTFRYDAVTVGPEHRHEMLFVRKAAHMGGWDIMPRAISAGIWRSVRLEAQPPAAIEQLYYWTAAVDANGATLGASFQFRTDAPMLDGFAMRFHGVCGDHEFDYTWPVEFVSDRCRIHAGRQLVAQRIRQPESVR